MQRKAGSNLGPRCLIRSVTCLPKPKNTTKDLAGTSVSSTNSAEAPLTEGRHWLLDTFAGQRIMLRGQAPPGCAQRLGGRDLGRDRRPCSLRGAAVPAPA